MADEAGEHDRVDRVDRLEVAAVLQFGRVADRFFVLFRFAQCIGRLGMMYAAEGRPGAALDVIEELRALTAFVAESAGKGVALRAPGLLYSPRLHRAEPMSHNKWTIPAYTDHQRRSRF